jgi:hypothetical protein
MGFKRFFKKHWDEFLLVAVIVVSIILMMISQGLIKFGN